jgi:hypothetical protein
MVTLAFPELSSAFPRRAVLLLAAATALASCRLIDQNTFAPAPEAKVPPAASKPAAPPASPEGRTALMVIEPGTRLENYRNVLHEAVMAARRRDPAVRFDVVSVVPAGNSLSEQVKTADSTRPEAVAVANELIASGVPASHVELGARPDPRAEHPEIRVYVR